MIQSKENPLSMREVFALWLAVNSDHGERLLQIALEHSGLAQMLLDEDSTLTDPEKENIRSRMASLNEERDMLIGKIEELDADPVLELVMDCPVSEVDLKKYILDKDGGNEEWSKA